MSKGSRPKGDLARRPAKSLGHTANVRPSREPLALSTVRSTLMRTVLGDTRRVAPNPFPAAQKRVRSPTVVVRATGRSSQKQVRSPFLNATLFTPQLSERSMVCARRHIRREVLFAKRRTNGSGSRRRRSKVGC